MLLAVCLYARSVRAASLGLFFILLFAVPLGYYLIGGAGIINQLIELNNPRLLAIFLLLPIWFDTRRFERRQVTVFTLPDWLVVGYVLLLTALQFRNTEVTNVMRAGTLNALDVLIPYFAFSRAVTSMADIRKIFLAFVIAVLPLSLIAIVELAKGWHLYAALATSWETGASYLRRDGLLRATASSSTSISLGFIIMVAVGCMLAIWHTVQSSRFKGIVLATLAAGLISSLARGPWVGLAVLVLVYLAMGPGAIANLGVLAVIGAVGLALLSLIPEGMRLFDFLPFVGSVDVGSVSYRQKLFDHAILVIQQFPLFGTPDYRATPEMLEMMNSEGMIDIVNTYLEFAMRSGLVGLSMFVGVFATILLRLWRTLKFHGVRDANFNTCVRASIATLIGMLVTIATVSSIDFIPYVYWSFAGLCVALIRISYKERSAAVRAVSPNHVSA